MVEAADKQTPRPATPRADQAHRPEPARAGYEGNHIEPSPTWGNEEDYLTFQIVTQNTGSIATKLYSMRETLISLWELKLGRRFEGQSSSSPEIRIPCSMAPSCCLITLFAPGRHLKRPGVKLRQWNLRKRRDPRGKRACTGPELIVAGIRPSLTSVHSEKSRRKTVATRYCWNAAEKPAPQNPPWSPIEGVGDELWSPHCPTAGMLRSNVERNGDSTVRDRNDSHRKPECDSPLKVHQVDCHAEGPDDPTDSPHFPFLAAVLELRWYSPGVWSAPESRWAKQRAPDLQPS